MEGTCVRMETDPIKQIAIFRVPELQLCLQQLQLSKSGLKSILQARLSNHLRSVIATAEQAAPTDRLQQKKTFAGRLYGFLYILWGIPWSTALRRHP